MSKDRIHTPTFTSEALASVLEERLAQDMKWGEQNHSPSKWLVILMEEVGEFSKASLERPLIPFHPDVRKEAVQVAAVALAMIECCDRNNWVPKEVPV